MNKSGVSVIICCYNSAERLPETLKHLSQQTCVNDINWEVIVINNNSTDNTSEVAEEQWIKYGSVTVLKVVHEPSPGLTNARVAGIKAASFNYIIFCDDDNWLNPMYVYHVANVLQHNNNIGMVGPCKIEAVYESEKPKWLEGQENVLCVFDTFKDEIYVTKNDAKVLRIAGAGMGVRKEILLQYVEKINKHKERLLLDRNPVTMLSGGDDDINIVALELGYDMLLTGKLNMKHFIPTFRMKQDYILKLYEGMAYSMMLVNYFNKKPLPGGWSMVGMAKHLLVDCVKKPFKYKVFFRTIKGRKKARVFLRKLQEEAHNTVN